MLPLSFYKPTIAASGSDVTYNPVGNHLFDLSGEVDLSFTLEADGGYWQADIPLPVTSSEQDEWIQDGLGRHVEIYSPGGIIIFEGVVNQISLQFGGVEVVIGPLFDIINRCSVTYALSEIVGNEIVTTNGMTTVVADNDDSKLRYGVFEKILAGGTIISDTYAVDLRDTYLSELAWPSMSKKLSLGGSSAQSSVIHLSIIGYINFLKNYVYTANTPSTHNISVPIYDPTNANSKLRLLLLDDPNNLFTDESKWTFDTVNVLEPLWDDQDSDAHTIMRTMVEKGDNANTRCVFGIYANRNAIYKAIPSSVKYNHTLTDPGQNIITYGGANMVEEWDVEAGEWLLFTDFLIGTADVQFVNIAQNQRAMFIERVAFSTPRGLELDGEKVGTVKQKLARMGLGV